MVDILNKTAVATTMSTGLNVTTTLSLGSYAVWAQGQNGYIVCPPSTGLAVTTGYPVIGGAAPITMQVPENGQIGFLSSSSGTFVYMKLGA